VAAHHISIKNARGVGYYLRKEVREEIYRQLAQHDANNIPKRQPAQARASP
jgi:hypothetical protein